MESMVDRVAKAQFERAYHVHAGEPSFESLPEGPEKDEWRAAARAAIAAMREPLGAMQADGRDVLLEYVDVLRKPVRDQWQLARDTYRAMIDAALQDTADRT